MGGSVDLEKTLISAGGKPVASGSVGADVGSVGMAALILTDMYWHNWYCTNRPDTHWYWPSY